MQPRLLSSAKLGKFLRDDACLPFRSSYVNECGNDAFKAEVDDSLKSVESSRTPHAFCDRPYSLGETEASFFIS